MNDKITTIFSSPKKAPIFPGKGNKLGYEGNINFVPESEDRIYHSKSISSKMNADALENSLYSESMGVVSVKRFEEWSSCIYLDKYATDYYYVIQHRTNPNFNLHHWIAMQEWNKEQQEKATKIFEDAMLELVGDSINDFGELEKATKFIFNFKPSIFKEGFRVNSYSYDNFQTLSSNSVKFNFTGPVVFKLIRLVFFFLKWILCFWT